MKFIADFHVHSKYSRATSRDMDIETLSRWAKTKGIALLGTGDFTHPLWLSELKSKLKPSGNGIYCFDETKFILTAEISNIFTKAGELKKIHNLIFAPSFEIVENINARLRRIGNLVADGRPTLGLTAKDLAKIVLDISDECVIIPAHAWTPWFSLFGANSGFDSIQECFEELTSNIFSIETGLSSDPEMNWRLSALDSITLTSNSDAHSPNKVGREANVFDCEIDYYEIIDVMKRKDRKKFLYTIEFFPQEGKYHWDGHRNCNQRLSPKQTKGYHGICPTCGKKLTVGVMHRVEDLADREDGFILENAIGCKHLIPLEEIIAAALTVGANSVAVKKEYDNLIQRLDNEFNILLDVPEDILLKNTSKKIVEGILRVRKGKVNIIPGYDGVYGEIKIFAEQEKERKDQLSLF